MRRVHPLLGVVLCDAVLKEQSFPVTPTGQRQCNSSERGRFNATTAFDKINATPSAKRGSHLLCLLTPNDERFAFSHGGGGIVV